MTTRHHPCRLVEDDDRPRLTPTAHEDMLPLRFPSTYRRRWRPLRPVAGDHRIYPLDKVAMDTPNPLP